MEEEKDIPLSLDSLSISSTREPECYPCKNILGEKKLILFGVFGKRIIVNENKNGFSDLTCISQDYKYETQDEEINAIFRGKCDPFIEIEVEDKIIKILRQYTFQGSKCTFYMKGERKYVSFYGPRKQELFNILLKKKKIDQDWNLSKKEIKLHVIKLLFL
jgi:flavodoxin